MSADSAARKITSSTPCKPFLKWAGGKRQLLEELLARVPCTYGRYFEPFVGSGALFFALQPKTANLSDLNSELVNSYVVVRDQVEELIKDLESHRYEESYYYTLRNIDRSSEFQNWSEVKKAGRVICLNKTCYNGLYRVNSKGYFNTPFGRYDNPRILDAENLRACSRVLTSAEITCAPFECILDKAGAGDFVYFDPPYIPISQTSNFTAYAKQGFGLKEQEALSAVCRELDNKQVYFMLSNSFSERMEKLYQGFKQEKVSAKRAINSKAKLRGAVTELIVRNY